MVTVMFMVTVGVGVGAGFVETYLAFYLGTAARVGGFDSADLAL